MRFPRHLPVALALALSLAACASAPERVPEAARPAPPPIDDAPIIIVKKRPPAEAPSDDAPRESPREAPRDELRAPPPSVVLGEPPDDLDPKRTLRLWTLDVGQGSATLVELPCGAILIDTGGELNKQFDSRVALEHALDAFFARRPDLKRTLDLVVITHPHIDHMRGLPLVLDRYRVKNIVDNGNPGDEIVEEEMRALRAFLDDRKNRRVGRRSVRTEDIPYGKALTDRVIDPLECRPTDPVVRVLSGGLSGDPGWGEDRYKKRRFHNENNHSVVVRVDFGESSVLITGDLEDVAIEDLVRRYEGTGLLDVDVYVVGHHGSHNGTTRGQMDAMTPDAAVMSMGPDHRRRSWTAWRYGHPRQQTVSLLEEGVRLGRAPVEVKVATGVREFFTMKMHKAVYGTGWDGTVVLEATDDGRLFVRTGSVLAEGIPETAAR